MNRQCEDYSIREKAEAIIAEHEKTVFTKEDWYMFFDMLDNSPEPTERMKKAAETYLDIFSQFPHGVHWVSGCGVCICLLS